MTTLQRGDTVGPYPYRIIEQIGRGDGGMSKVYLASVGPVDSPDAHDLVALKIANVDDENRSFYKRTLDNETEILRRLDHPGVVRLYRIRGGGLPRHPIYSAQTDLPESPWFSVLEYLAGGSLAELLEEKEVLAPALSAKIAYNVAKTLAYIHGLGYVHLDIKPENILFRRPIEQEVEPVLIDFGIARGIGQGGLEAGTLQWLPPERVITTPDASDLDVSVTDIASASKTGPQPAMDIYSLGLVLYQMVTGRAAFATRSRTRMARYILLEEAEPPSELVSSIPRELEEAIQLALEKSPDERPTAGNLARLLQPLARSYRPASATTSTHRVTETAPEQSGSKIRWQWLLTAALVLTVVVTGFVVYNEMWASGGEEENLQIAAATITRTARPTWTQEGVAGTSDPTSTPLPTHTPAHDGDDTTAASGAPTPTETIMPTSTPVTLSELVSAATEFLEQQTAATATSVTNDTPPATATATEQSVTATQETAATPTATSTLTATLTPAAGPSLPGGRIAFPIYVPSQDRYSVYTARPDGSDRRLVSEHMRQPAFSPDGRIVMNGQGGGTDSIWFMNPDGSMRHQVGTHPEDSYPSWSPESNRIAMSSILHGDGRSRIYVYTQLKDSQEPELLMEGSYEMYGRYPTWLHDWRIAFTGCNYWEAGGRCGIYVVDPSGGYPVQMTRGGTNDLSPDAAGNRLTFMSHRTGDWDVYVTSLSGGGAQNITDHPSDDGLPTWSPNGRWIAFLSNRDGNWAIWATTPDGQTVQKLFDLNGVPGADWTKERISWGATN